MYHKNRRYSWFSLSNALCSGLLAGAFCLMLFKRRSETASDPSPPSYAVEWSLGQFRNPTAFGTTAARTRSKAIFNRFTNVGVDDPDADVALVSLFFSLRDDQAAGPDMTQHWWWPQAHAHCQGLRQLGVFASVAGRLKAERPRPNTEAT